MTTRPSPTTRAAAAEDDQVTILQADIRTQLRELATSADLVTLLLDTTQDLGLAGESGITRTKSAEAPAPGSVAAYSMAAEIHATLTHSASYINRHLRQAGVHALIKNPDLDPTTSQLIGRVLALTHAAPSPRLLRAVLFDLSDLTERAGALVDGDSTWEIPVPCPHCGLTTLVGHQYPKRPEHDVVICARNRDRRGDRRYTKCVCKNPLCQCHVDPVRFRHRWFNTTGWGVETWNALSDLINPPESRKRTRKRDRRRR